MNWRIVTILLTLWAVPALASQSTEPTKPAEALTPGGAKEMRVIVEAVKGIVQARESDDQPWKPATPGMTLTQGAEFRTGPRSSVSFRIPPDQTVILDRLGTMKVLQAIEEANGKVKTDLGVKYGRTQYDIEAGSGVEHESTIRSPSATLAVRGTNVVFASYAGVAPTARWNKAGFNKAKHDSQAKFTDAATGQSVVFGGGAEDAQMKAGESGAAGTARSEGVLAQQGPRGPGDSVLVNNIGGPNGPPGTGPGGPRPSAPPPPNRPDVNTLNLPKPQFNLGNLVFNLTWGAPVADLDVKMTLTNSTGGKETLFSSPASEKGGATRTSNVTGLVHTGDNTGSANGGMEVVRSSLPPGIPVGRYDVEVRMFPETGLNPVPYTLQVLRNGQEVERFEGTVTPTTTGSHTLEVQKNAPAGG